MFDVTLKLMTFFSVFLTFFLLSFAIASWVLFYDAETERLSSHKAKNMRIASICVVVLCILILTFLALWFLAEFRNNIK